MPWISGEGGPRLKLGHQAPSRGEELAPLAAGETQHGAPALEEVLELVAALVGGPVDDHNCPPETPQVPWDLIGDEGVFHRHPHPLFSRSQGGCQLVGEGVLRAGKKSAQVGPAEEERVIERPEIVVGGLPLLSPG